MSVARPKKADLPHDSGPRRVEAVSIPADALHDPIDTPEQFLELHLSRFLAWSNDGERVVAQGRSFEGARRVARAKGEPDPIVEQEPIPARRT